MKRLVILFCLSMLYSGCESSTQAGGSSSGVVAYIRQGLGDYGTVVYTYDGHYIRQGLGAYGTVIYTYDGHYIRQGLGDYGTVVYTVDLRK